MAADIVVLAVPWSKVADVFDPRHERSSPWLAAPTQFESAPITGVHLWFDRPIMPLPHAVLVGRLEPVGFQSQAGSAEPTTRPTRADTTTRS